MLVAHIYQKTLASLHDNYSLTYKHAQNQLHVFTKRILYFISNIKELSPEPNITNDKTTDMKTYIFMIKR